MSLAIYLKQFGVKLTSEAAKQISKMVKRSLKRDQTKLTELLA
jgi:hypothetical protein